MASTRLPGSGTGVICKLLTESDVNDSDLSLGYEEESASAQNSTVYSPGVTNVSASDPEPHGRVQL